jgi:hypothetical protein
MRRIPYWLATAVWLCTACDRGSDQPSADSQETATEHVAARRDGVLTQQAAATQANRAAQIQDSTVVELALSMSASPVRDVYYRDGPMDVQLTFHNASDSMIVFRPTFYFGAWLDAEVLDSVGKAVSRTMEIDPPSPLNTLETFIRPRQSLTARIDLRCAIPAPEVPCDGPYDALSEPGVYEVKMRFTLPCEEGSCGTVHAEPFTVCVADLRRPTLGSDRILRCGPRREQVR